MNHVGHNYFETMGIPIVRGRAFTEDDEREHSMTRKFAIVNETMAAKYWPGEDPSANVPRLQLTEPLLEVVGVARDSKYVVVFEAPRPYSICRSCAICRSGRSRARHRRSGRARAASRARGPEMAPDMPIADLRTMAQSLPGIFGYLIFRVGAIQAGGMGLLGLILAVDRRLRRRAFGASLRTREIGIRVALGAQPRDVLRLILGQGLQLVAVGLVVGLLVSAGLSRVIARFLPLVDARIGSPMARSRRASALARAGRVLHSGAPRHACASDDGVET